MKFINKKNNYISFIAFTLAEVVIVIGIIGIIAEMTIPNLISDFRKTEIATRTKKFYSTFSQAIKLSEVENGDSRYWTMPEKTYDSIKVFLDTYLPVLKYEKIEPSGPQNAKIYFNDGTTGLVAKGGCVDFIFDANGPKPPNSYGKDKFTFLFCQGTESTNFFETSNKTFGAYYENKSRSYLLSVCTTDGYSCSGLLMHDGWEFKSDYPYKF